jgi:predicted RNase H-like HicB family nuclease
MFSLPGESNKLSWRIEEPQVKLFWMKLLVTLERDETGIFVVECPSIPGCISQGKTEQEAIANIREAIVGCLETRAANGMPLTVDVREVEVNLWWPSFRLSRERKRFVHSSGLVGGKIVSAAAMSFLSKRPIMLPCRFLNTANWHPERSALSSVHPVSVSKNLSLSYS